MDHTAGRSKIYTQYIPVYYDQDEGYEELDEQDEEEEN